MSDVEEAEPHALSVERRLERLEHGFAAIALRLTANHPLRGSSVGNTAAQGIVLEYEAVQRDLEREAKRDGLAAQVAELDGVAV